MIGDGEGEYIVALCTCVDEDKRKGCEKKPKGRRKKHGNKIKKYGIGRKRNGRKSLRQITLKDCTEKPETRVSIHNIRSEQKTEKKITCNQVVPL